MEGNKKNVTKKGYQAAGCITIQSGNIIIKRYVLGNYKILFHIQKDCIRGTNRLNRLNRLNRDGSGFIGFIDTNIILT
ncbi:MAG: hypothetical protein AB1765_03195 [Candidatus Hydrogenedentota bacterium]